MSDALTPTKPIRGKNGGARPGAGRKARAEIYKSHIREAEAKICDQLPYIVDDLIRRARGQYSETRLEMEPAGHLYRDDFEHYEVDVKGVKQQRYKKVKVLLYPNLPPDQMVVTKHIETNFSPDFSSAKYLMDRIMGPPQAIPDEELAYARASLANQQYTANFYLVQAALMQAQRDRQVTENKLFPQQFVTEEQERERTTSLAMSLLAPILHLTPDKAAEFGIPPERLEDFKAHLSVEYSQIIEAVYASQGKEAEEEDNDTEEAGE